MLLDRVAERSALDGLLDGARAWRSGVLVVRGVAGIGKTALLDYAAGAAPGLRIARVAGIESEMELPFAALHQLCAPMLDGLDRLPDPQREALSVAFGLRSGEPPDRFLVGLAALSLLSEVAEERPLLCVIDDAQWLDQASAQALGFVARRLLAEPVVLLIAAREPGEEFTRLPELHVRGLSDGAARELLESVITGPLDERVQERIIAETGGNPLALLELPRGLSPAEVAGGFGLLDVPRLSDRIEDSFLRQLRALPAAARRLLLVAAAEPGGDPALVWRAAGRLRIGMDAAAAAGAAGLVTIGERVTFRHPLVRSAAYQAASPHERRAVHVALADATDPLADPDRRAWHRAQAVTEPDEEVAGELERSAGRAQARGGEAAAAAFLERSAALTPGPARRAGRALAAAQAKCQTGAFHAARGLLAAAEAGPLGESRHAQADLLRAQIAFASNRGSDAPPLLLKAARQFVAHDRRLARDTYLEALAASIFTGGLAHAGGMQEVASAAHMAPAPPGPPRASDLLLDGLALIVLEGHRAGLPVLRQAVTAFRGTGLPGAEVRWLWLACHAAGLIWDYESWDVLSARQIKVAKEAGALISLPVAFNTRAGVHLFAGEFAEAASVVAEAESVIAATGSSMAPYGALALAVMQGQDGQAARLTEATRADAARRGEGEGLSFVHWATAVLCNSRGRYQEALAAAGQASEDSPALWFASWAAVELIEAATRTGAPERAAGALQRLSEITHASSTDWALGLAARSGALVSDGESAESRYREAIDRLGRARLPVERARAQLVYGEWLRRRQRTGDARVQLRRACQAFDTVGAGAFAHRARIELRAAGGHARRRAADTADALTAQEALIARLAGGGASNPQIAAELFISSATVAYHLRKVFTKLDVSSRTQLARALPSQSGDALSGTPLA